MLKGESPTHTRARARTHAHVRNARSREAPAGLIKIQTHLFAIFQTQKIQRIDKTSWMPGSKKQTDVLQNKEVFAQQKTLSLFLEFIAFLILILLQLGREY